MVETLVGPENRIEDHSADECGGLKPRAGQNFGQRRYIIRKPVSLIVVDAVLEWGQ